MQCGDPSVWRNFECRGQDGKGTVLYSLLWTDLPDRKPKTISDYSPSNTDLSHADSRIPFNLERNCD